jgi:hypothetical protein
MKHPRLHRTNWAIGHQRRLLKSEVVSQHEARMPRRENVEIFSPVGRRGVVNRETLRQRAKDRRRAESG